MIGRATRSVANWLRGRPRLAGWALKLLPDVPMTVTVSEIGRFRIRARRNRSFWLRDPLVLEEFPLAALRALVRPGDVVYDVGANIGLYTRFCVTAFKAGHVVAFEPMKDNQAQLRRNVELGGIADKVTILPYALSDEEGVQQLQVDDVSSASAVLSVVAGNQAAEGRRQYGFAPKSEPVTCRRLDSVIDSDGVPPPDVLKVDIEGAEDLFLAGAGDCLATRSPRLMVELHGADKARRVFRSLADRGYHCAGRVSPEIAAGGYARLTGDMMAAVADYYAVHFLLASKDPGDLPQTVAGFRLS